MLRSARFQPFRAASGPLLPFLLLPVAFLAGCSDDSTGESTPGDISVTASVSGDLGVPGGTRLNVRVSAGGSHLGEQVVPLQAGSRQWTATLSPRPDTPVGVTLQAEARIVDATGRVLWSGEVSGTLPESGASLQVLLRGGGPALAGATAVRIGGPDRVEVVEGQTLALDIEVDGGTASLAVILTESPSVVRIDSEGRLLAVGPGTTRVVVLAGTGSDAVTVEVLPRIDRLSVTPGAVLLDALGGTADLVASAVDIRGEPMILRGTVLWSSRDEGVATVDASGRITARGPGETVVRARLAGQEGIEGSVPVSVRQQVAGLEFVRGAGQEGRVAEPLGEAPVVRLLDPLGSPVAGVRVVFQASGGGRVVHESRVTEASGEASPGSWVLGGALGVQHLTAIAPNGASATLEAVARTGRPARVVPVSPVDQDADAGANVAHPPEVRVEDAGGNPVPNVEVAFSVVSGGGTITPSALRTDAGGVARAVRWRTGPATGVQAVEAAVPGVAPARFAARVNVGPPAALAVTDGAGQAGLVDAVLPVAPEVRVTDAGGVPVPGVTVAFAVAAGGGSVTGDVGVTDADGRARVGSWRLGTVAGAQALEASVAGGPSTTIAATALPGPASAAQSSLAVTPHAAGDSTVVATVTVRDAFGNVRTAGGDAPQVGGPLGAAVAVDQGDGTYVATVPLAVSTLWEALIPLVSEVDPMAGTGSNSTAIPVEWEVTEGAAPASYPVDVTATLGGDPVGGSPASTTVVPANFPTFRVVSWWVRAEAGYGTIFIGNEDVVPPAASFARVETSASVTQTALPRRTTAQTTAGVSFQGGVLRLDIAGTHTAEEAADGAFFRSGVRVTLRSFRPLEATGSSGCFQQDLPGGSYWRARLQYTLAFTVIVDEWLVGRDSPGPLGNCPP